jgi:hypothetical protein
LFYFCLAPNDTQWFFFSCVSFPQHAKWHTLFFFLLCFISSWRQIPHQNLGSVQWWCKLNSFRLAPETTPIFFSPVFNFRLAPNDTPIFFSPVFNFRLAPN